MLRLDLGSGAHPEPGYQGVDIAFITDWRCDLSEFPWRVMDTKIPTGPIVGTLLADSSVEAVHCSHLVEHMVDLVGFMRELYHSRRCRT